MKKIIFLLLLTAILFISCISNTKIKEQQQNEPLVDTEVVVQVEEPHIPGYNKDLPSLAEVYADYFKIGTCVEVDQLQGPEAELVLKHYNSLTAENIMKPQYISPKKNDFFFGNADKLIDFAKTNNLLVRGHTLLWHQQNAQWMFYDDDGNEVSKDLLLQRLETYITTVVSRYKGKIYAWDVANEVFSRTGFRASKWFKICGEEYIEKAFIYARNADPGAKLFINEIEVTERHKRNNMYDRVKKLLDMNVPIDGVGLQFHMTLEYPGLKAIKDTLEKFSTLGIEIHITELDMSLNGDPNLKAEKADPDYLTRQAHRYKEIFEIFKEYENITNVTFWGFQDGHTWLTYSPVVKPDWPLIFDKDLNVKPAYWGLVDPSKLPEDVVIENTNNNNFIAIASKGTPVIDGTKENIWNSSEDMAIEIFIEGAGSTGTGKALWDDKNLYVFVEVYDKNLSKENEAYYQQDTVEIFLDELNNKSSDYLDDDAQYRLNFVNEMSTRGNPAEVVSEVLVTEVGYNVEIMIPFRFVEPEKGLELGFDLQVNDDPGTGFRNSYSKWNDRTNESFRNTSGFGTLVLGE